MYTADDLVQIKKAILDLAQGKRVVQVQFNDQVVRYASTDLEKLQQLEQRIRQQLIKRPKQYRVYTSRGL